MDFILKKDETEVEGLKEGWKFIDQEINVTEMTNNVHRTQLNHCPEQLPTPTKQNIDSNT